MNDENSLTSPGISLRRFLPKDLPELVALNSYGFSAAGIPVDQDYYSGEDFADLQSAYSEAAGGALFVGEIDSTIVAMGGIRQIDPKVCELLRMRVYPQYQRRGYGSAILELIEREAKRLGYSWIVLLTGEEQHPAVDLYDNRGYCVESREEILGISSVRMKKRI